MEPHTDAYKVTWLIRRLFRAMGETADSYLQASGLTAADRAVMEFLYPEEHLTVPGIAHRYQVSRQHVQVTANRLLEQGLVRSTDNPRHKRSPLFHLSALGRDAFAEIRRNESDLLDAMFADIELADVATTRRTLEALLIKFNPESQRA
ncbi:MAG: MarR family transcriptional regulator [Woeseiaceae bacterium]|nr:MarR family transcriptional regulator [Woeseiaceae bacterium]